MAAPKKAAAIVPVSVDAPTLASEAARDTIVASVDLVAALQQQSQVLARLAGELESQRRVIGDQQKTIAAMEAKAAAAVPAAPAAPALPITVDTGGPKLRLSGTVQGQYSAGNSGIVDTFRLRRAEIKLTGEINARAKWSVMIDPAKALSVSNSYVTLNGQRVVAETNVSQSGRVLQDVLISLQRSSNLVIEVGQQRIPLGLEGTTSGARQETVERALFMSDRSRGGAYGDVRDLGVVTRGKAAGGQVELAGGVFNGLGEGMNDVDRNEQKAFAGRVLIKPRVVKGLQFGASAARGAFVADDATRRERQGVELVFARGPLNARSEFVVGRDGAVPRQGYYVHAGVRPHKRVELVSRMDRFDPDTRGDATVATVAERDWLGGVNWQVSGNAVLLQLNYVHKTFMDVQKSRQVFLANLQTAW